MIYALHDQAGEKQLSIEGESFKHLVKARRMKVGDTITLRALNIDKNFSYELLSIGRKEASFSLQNEQEHSCVPSKELHIGWCKIDVKSVEKVLASAVELGVSSISFIACDRSQHNIVYDEKRFERMVHGAMQQSGRTSKLELIYDLSLEDFLDTHDDITVLDFAPDSFSHDSKSSNAVLIGAEGGFCSQEKELLQAYDVKRLNTPMVLRSETAMLAVASLLLL